MRGQKTFHEAFGSLEREVKSLGREINQSIGAALSRLPGRFGRNPGHTVALFFCFYFAVPLVGAMRFRLRRCVNRSAS